MVSYVMVTGVYADYSIDTGGPRFATKEEAEAYGRDVCSRWLESVNGYRVLTVDGPPTHKFIVGGVISLDKEHDETKDQADDVA